MSNNGAAGAVQSWVDAHIEGCDPRSASLAQLLVAPILRIDGLDPLLDDDLLIRDAQSNDDVWRLAVYPCDFAREHQGVRTVVGRLNRVMREQRLANRLAGESERDEA
jgi:hypothetical protein